MSRRAFRIDVADPRPASAWAMVAVASATLWITQQLGFWVMIVQALAIIVSLWRRHNPFAWQRSPVALNAGMMIVTGTTIQVALAGGPATIGLAHFAALAQGLQLVDARPRRTEFLLVALALFQVVLASNLTDSVFFPPLLVAFLFATVWTLIVHTVRSEALEAGDQRGAPEALSVGLLRVTLIASGASVLLAMVLFLVLPRLRTSILENRAIGPGVATAGFSDKVSLGELGRIRQDATIVMRVTTLDGEAPEATAAYWRGLAFDHFDGESWSITPSQRRPVPGSPEIGIRLGSGAAEPDLVQLIVREPVESGVLFGIGRIRELQGTVRLVERDVNGGLYAAGMSSDRIRYRAASERPRPSERSLRDDSARPPDRDGERYLQLPPLSSAIIELAQQIVRDETNDADRMRALERYLITNGRYSDTPPVIEEGSDRSALEAFLFGDMSAHCEYYASALVVLARSVGLPARLVNGFAGGRDNPIGDFVELSRSHAHAWTEVHYQRAGWVRYDATPPDLRLRAEAAVAFDERMRQLASAVELWWFQRIVGFDRSDQMQALKSAWLAWRGEQEGRNGVSKKNERDAWHFGAGHWRNEVLAGVAVGAALIVLFRMRRAAGSEVPHYYERALQLLRARGLVRTESTPARQFARTAAEALPAPAAHAFAQLTEWYLAQRFGAHAAPDASAQLAALRAGLSRRARAAHPSAQSAP